MTPPETPPTDTDAIIVDGTSFCDEHTETLSEWDIPLLNAVSVSTKILVENPDFFEIAYRKKNGYSKPDDVSMDDVPEGEKPGVEHINDAISEIEAPCCWIVENVENPFENQPAPALIGILSHKAAEGTENYHV